MACGACSKLPPGEYDPKNLTPEQAEIFHQDGVPEGYGQITGEQLQNLGLDPKFCSIQVTPHLMLYNGDPICLEGPPCC
jgi:hypothetical protein